MKCNCHWNSYYETISAMAKEIWFIIITNCSLGQKSQSQSFISAYIDIQNTVITDPDNGTSSYPVEAAIMHGCRIADYTLQPNHEAGSSAYLCMPGFRFAHVVWGSLQKQPTPTSELAASHVRTPASELAQSYTSTLLQYDRLKWICAVM